MSKADLIGRVFGKLTVISYVGYNKVQRNSIWKCKCDCGGEKDVLTKDLSQGAVSSCGCLNKSMNYENYDEERERRFWTFVEKTDSCWIWKGSLDPAGYGSFTYKSQNVKAHRYIFERANKRKIERNYCICHRCDNPSCVNPDHLYEGTYKDNSLDRQREQRWGNVTRRYSDLQKKAILTLTENKVSPNKISKLLNISNVGIRNFLKRRKNDENI